MTTNEIALRESMAFDTPGPMSYPEMLKIGEALCAAGWFKDVKNAGQAAVKIMLGQELGVSPLTAMRGIYVIETKRGPVVVLAADLSAKLMKAHGYDWTVDQLDARACRLTVLKNGRKVGEVEFTFEMAKRAGLLNREGPWHGFQEDMLFAKAIARAQRRFAPEVTGGFPLPVVEAEDLAGEYPDPRDDVMRALFATYRERFPKWRQEETEDYRSRRLMWSGQILSRWIETWNGPEAPETLTRADVRTLMDALESETDENTDYTEALEASIAQAQVSAGPVPGAEGQGKTSVRKPAEVHQAAAPAAQAGPALSRATGPADSSAGASDPVATASGDSAVAPAEPVAAGSFEGSAPGKAAAVTQDMTGTAAAPARPGHPVNSSGKPLCMECGGPISDDELESQNWRRGMPGFFFCPKCQTSTPADQTIAAVHPRPKRQTPKPGQGSTIEQAQREAQEFREARRTQQETEHTPTDPLQLMEPAFREPFVEWAKGNLEAARNVAKLEVKRLTRLGEWAGEWTLPQYEALASKTFERKAE